MTCTAFGIFGIFFEQSFIDTAFDVRSHEALLFFINEVNEFEEFGGVLDFVLAFGKDLAEDALGLTEFSQKGGVVAFEFGSAFVGEAFPDVAGGNGQFTIVGGFTKFVG